MGMSPVLRLNGILLTDTQVDRGLDFELQDQGLNNDILLPRRPLPRLSRRVGLMHGLFYCFLFPH